MSYRLSRRFGLARRSSADGVSVSQPISLWRPSSALGLPHLDIAAPSPDPSRRGRGRRGCRLGGQGELRFASYVRHLFNEGDGDLGLQSRFNLPCRTLSSPQGSGESIPLYHGRGSLAGAAALTKMKSCL